MSKNEYLNLYIKLYNKLKYGTAIILWMVCSFSYGQDTVLTRTIIDITEDTEGLTDLSGLVGEYYLVENTRPEIREKVNVLGNGDVKKCEYSEQYSKMSPDGAMYSAAFYRTVTRHNWVYSKDLHNPLLLDTIVSVHRRICDKCHRHEEVIKYEVKVPDPYEKLLNQIKK